MVTRRLSIRTVVGVMFFASFPAATDADTVPYTRRWDVQFRSLNPERILTKLDLNAPGLEAVKRAADRGDRIEALAALRDHYRAKYPLGDPPKTAPIGRFEAADNLVRHVFQWGPYEPADYGEEINWQWDPRGDIEWVAAVYRFHWATPLADAYRATRDEKYARTFVELASDWIARHPLEKRDKRHPVYTHWRGFAWLDIQTGIRATRICQTFPTFVHAASFTPEFLGVLLASLYDHQVKTGRVPMGMVHNKAIFEQRGFANVAYTFPEFKESKAWMRSALAMAGENLLAQTTADGVQREWSGGYHVGVLRDAVEMAERAESVGIDVPAAYRQRVRKMFDYIFWIATPDLGFPMFGDCGRAIDPPEDRSRWPLYGKLLQGTQTTGDPRYAARARLDRGALPAQASFAFAQAGMYVMRSGWGPEQIYLALHCSPPAISGHDQPDNGTFELYAFGRWLMTDTGYYTYGHDPEARKWHRQTRVHQTLTLDGENANVAGRQRLWQTGPEFDALVVENQSYPDLRHRRSVWFVNRRFFVLLDEAIGEASGILDLHFQLAVGDARLDAKHNRATTGFDDANVLVQAASADPIELIEEEGWFAWSYGKRKRRTAFALRQKGGGPRVFVTLLVPYKGTAAPNASADLPADFAVGADAVSLQVTVAGRTWRVGRDLARQKAWCQSN